MASARKTLGDYLLDNDPLHPLWLDLVNTVFRDSPNEAHAERLSPSARVLYDVGMFAGELVNGGMSQFFSNSSGNRAHESLTALRSLGADISVGLLEKALTLFPDGVAPKDRVKRCDLLFAFEARDPRFLEELTQEYYKRVDALGSIPEEDLMALELAFIRTHVFDPIEASN